MAGGLRVGAWAHVMAMVVCTQTCHQLVSSGLVPCNW